MFKPVYAPNFERKLNSLYITPQSNINSGGFVDVDTTDHTAITGSVGYTAMRAGTVALATINSSSAVPKELGIALVDATQTGPTLIQRILRLGTAYMQIPWGSNLAVYTPTSGDMFGTTEFVGYLGSGDHGTGWIDVTSTSILNSPCEVYQGRLRIAQGSNPVRYAYAGTTSLNGSLVAMFRTL